MTPPAAPHELGTTLPVVHDQPRPRRRRRPSSACAGLILPRATTSPGRARQHIRAALAEWLVDEVDARGCELIVSELVTNAVDHTDTPLIRVICRLLDDVVTLTVAAERSHPGEIQATRPEDGDDHGRGLLIVQITADRWGVRQIVGDGVAVAIWAECTVSAHRQGAAC
ncbi:ATP-binding protein [Streptomyces sp. H10-C2]|uniref:ATP-binding protein n=1 Tax=Streptomyces TaxID=1883 RepID=UPI0018DF99CA|nr:MULTISPECIES: ATP-binding protein [Streptomyces]MDJ0344219.1 ATP-binding protein [Streptomyces sp. PH10-H1]MDJ0373557.1 ATP-binding protein [Streptomyces sp. H10-C2]